MKLTKKLEAEILDAYNECWMAYLKGDLKTHALYLSEKFKIIGTSEGEQYDSKKEWISYCKKTISQFAGVIQKRKNNINLLSSAEGVIVIEHAHLYVLIDDDWTFYSKIRISALLQKEKTGWKYIHQHGSFPDARANVDEPIATEQIKAENLELREAVKRRTTELENKNRELEIETSLERVRAVAMSMKESADMLDVCRTISHELQTLGVKEIRNLQTAIFYEIRRTYINYEYYAKHDKLMTTEVEYNLHKEHAAFANQMIKGAGEFYSHSFKGKKLKDWYAYQKTTNQFADTYLEKAKSLNYYMYSLGAVMLGISTYAPLNDEEINLFKRFLKVFELAYRRYLDIEKALGQAREAQIEASLERVRAQAMAMHHSDELSEVLAVLFEQFDVLAISPMYTFLSLIDLEKNNFTYRQTGRGGKRVIAQQIIDLDAMDLWKEAAERWKAAIYDTVETIYVPKELVPEVFKVYNEIYSTLPGDAKVYPEDFPEGMHSAIAASKFGHLGYDHFRPSTEEEKSILLRFNTEFVRLYQRFLDLQKAEAQAREAQIQLSLERVRARAMAMHHSDELNVVLPVLFDQFDILGIYPSHATISLLDVENNSFTFRMTGKAGKRVMAQQVISLDALTMWTDTVDRLKNLGSVQIYCNEYPKDILPKLWELCSDVIAAIPEDARPYPEDFPDGMYEAVGLYRLSGNTTHGTISFCHNRKPTEEEKEIVGRFATEFGRLYQRFLDLQNAEAQAREAKIDAALERVRARSMAMHHSNELHSVIETVTNQLVGINLKFDNASFCTVNKDGSWELWISTPQQSYPSIIHVPYLEHKIFSHIKEHQEKGIDFFSDVYTQEETKIFFHHFFDNTIARSVPEERKHYVYNSKGFARSAFLTINIWFTIGIYDRTPFSDEENNIIGRFAKVFEQSYTRFLDLQKAEAQAREAQIEAALEKVRSRSLAMHKSDELQEVINTLFDRLKELEIETDTACILITKNDYKDTESWIQNSEHTYSSRVFFPFFEKSIISREFLGVMEGGRDLPSRRYTKEEKNEWFTFLFEHSDLKHIPEERKQYVLAGEAYSISIANTKNGAIFLGRYNATPFAENEHGIIKRFAKVFEQAYTRFLDLEKAEAQAREAKIEAALERTRTQSMLMQHSDEIMNVSTVFHEQLLLLGIPTEFSYVWLPDEPKLEHQFWATWAEEENGTTICKSKAITYPLDKTEPYTAACFVAWESSEPVFIAHIAPPEVKNWFSTWEELLRGVENMDPALFPEGLYYAEAYMKYGCFGINIRRQLSKEEQEILRRFTVEFERTYTRFLDLQKAEAQAREAQIEAALERVRSQSMAMRTSEELKNVVKELRKQIGLLGQKELDTCVIQLYDESPDDVHCWASMTPSESNEEIRDFYRPIPKKGLLIVEEALQAYSSGRKDYLLLNEKEKLDQWIDFMKKIYPDIHSVIINTSHEAKPEHATHYWAFSDFNGGALLMVTLAPPTDVSRALLRRFANVFGLAYRRFVDIKQAEAQAKEAQIQLALERVRARTMAMHKSDELAEVAGLLFQQVKHLGVETYASGFNLWDKDHKNLVSWMSNPTGSINPPFEMPIHAYDQHSRIYASWKNNESFIEDDLTGEALRKHYEFLRSFPLLDEAFRKSEEAGIKTPDRQVHNNAYFSSGYLLFISPEPCPQYHDIFKRFAKVFEQTYTRFLDLQKAEAQAKEAKIEAALEKVRSRTMAMQRSDELADVAQLLFQQVKNLGITAWTTGFNIWQPDNDSYIDWVTDPTGGFLEPYTVQATSHPAFGAIREARLRGDDFFVSYLEGEQIRETYQLLSSFGDKGQFQKILDSGTPFPTHQFNHVVFGAQVSLLFITYEPCPEAHDIFKRFGKVFEQTYTRFLDLQKAEAQAREAKIEAALEKVRSRSLAMHKSDEIGGVLHTLFERLKELDIDFYTAIIIIFSKDSKDIEWWLESKANHLYPKILIPYADITYLRNLFEARENGNELLTQCYPFEEKNVLFDHLFSHTDLKYVPEQQKKFLLEAEFATMSVALAKNTAIHLTSYSRKSFSEQDHEVLKRFAKVFEQAYTRFLDLQKAEAQAREAQIEAALERVRSRSMAMHKSDELSEVVSVLYKQFEELDFGFYQVLVSIYDKTNNIIEWWSRGFWEFELPQRNIIPIIDHPFCNDLLEKWENGVEYYPHILGGEMKKSWDEYVFTKTDLKNFPQEVKDSMQSLDQVYLSDVFMKYGSLQSAGPAPLPNDKAGILKRFVKVLDQAYTRMIDLQKAEAQAREAQIQLALERVRARTMSMYKSEELAETAQVLFHQMIELGETPARISIGVLDEPANRVAFWATDQEGSQINFKFNARLDEPTSIAKMYAAWKEGRASLVIDLQGKELEDWIRFAREEIGIVVKAELLKDRRVHNTSFYSHGWILVTTHEPQSAESISVLERFASVFNLTFRRFLDLQKAEAQAKEAMIEAALEKVRSRAMAMHTSQELKDVALELRNQMGKMAQPELEVCAIHLYDESPDYFEAWAAVPVVEQGKTIQVQVKFPKQGVKIVDEMMEQYRSGKKDYVLVNHGEKALEWLDQLKEKVPHGYETIIQNLNGIPPEETTGYWSMADFKGGSLVMTTYIPPNDDARNLLRRFANVFGLAYQRFADLKQAEAQAREAQVELGLERVRARAMAMQKSNELKELIATVSAELGKLDLVLDRCLILTFDTKTKGSTWWMANPEIPAEGIGLFVKDHEHSAYLALLDAWRKRAMKWQYILEGEVKKTWDKFLFAETELSRLPEIVIANMRAQERVYLSASFNNFGCLSLATLEPLSDEQFEIMLRFAKVFDLTYTRFHDLQKAEAQASEARIEAALERVRSRTMGMQKSEELKEVIQVVYEQFVHLNINTEHTGFVMDYKVRDDRLIWVASKHGVPSQLTIPYFDSEYYNRFNEAKEKEWDFFATNLSFEEKNSFYRELFKHIPGLPDEAKEFYFNCPGLAISTVLLENIGLYIENFEGIPYSDEDNATLMRFGKVFQQTYTRFQDLEKAEAQAREAQIELGLERVRARAMAMQSSDELKELIGTVFIELTKLDIVLTRCLIMIYDTVSHDSVWWMANSEAPTDPIGLRIKYHEHAPYVAYIKAWREKNLKWVYVLEGADKKSWDDFLFAETELSHLPDFVIEGMKAPGRVYLNSSFNTFGNLTLATLDPLSNEHFDILLRFAKVFDLTYTRFNDLQKAEAQAREAKVEAALERVRSRSIAMHRSEEIADILGKIFTELTSLDVALNRALIWIFNPEEKYINWWSSNPEVESNAESYRVDYNEHPVFLTYLEAWQKRTPVLLYTLGGDTKASWDDHLFKNTGLSKIPREVQDGMRSEKSIFTTSAISDYGLLMVGCLEPFSNENNDIIQRFGRVFQQSFTRYVDVQKAETQAREATIEATMEKVRARAMAMQKPGELVEVAQLLRKEMAVLGVEELEGSSIFIHDEISGTTECWYAIQDVREQNTKLVSDQITINLNDTWVGREMLKFYISGQKQISILMQGENRKEWINYCAQHSKVLQGYYGGSIPDRTYHLLKFSSGYIGAASPGDLSAESWALLQRATTVFSLAYTRFNDLQQAEASAREAVKQAALDRIRAEIASMRTVFDLEKITPLIWNELTVLGISFIRCGVFIMDEAAKLTHTFLSTPDGKAIGAFHLPYDTPGNISKVISHWRDNQNYIDHWDVSAFTELAGMLVKQGAIPSTEQYLSTIPHGGFHLHFLPFLQGMLYVGNTTRLGEDEIGLIQSVADAFSTAYARYEDFNKLEAAKQQVDKTLVDLKQAQTQLVQSEKMASLGELTAGIAHEIQNPLNFVNNFSDVSNELLEEMKNELATGNMQQAIEIAEDVKQNLEKILHHGKRADAIVKGMLQHSRTSSGQKEPTDINGLADEYLRLAYHGLRAKDKSFNARFETDFDPTVEKINVVPQEIGRVILNLINNAFYAVSEKRKHASTGLSAEQAGSAGQPYEPVVTVSTRKTNGKISISVIDNGIGIPQKALDKIFQPFFTTKPTSQGTGLGLSLAYDIVTKGHGGELKVETKEGEGSEFIVSLPVV